MATVVSGGLRAALMFGLALLPGGGYAQYARVHESNALPIPAGLSMIEAAAIPETFFTVWTNVFDSGGLKAGEPHHYLIQGPTFLIEYDNTQDGANHVHCIYRDFDNDFGDALVDHYQKQHAKP